MHTHHTIMCTAVGGALWEGMTADSVVARHRPHVPCHRHAAQPERADLRRRHHRAAAALGPGRRRLHDRALRASRTGPTCRRWWWICSPIPHTAGRDLSSLQNIFGGGASMPEAVAQKLFELCGVEYMEAYGMTETISQTHVNPPGRLQQAVPGHSHLRHRVDRGRSARRSRRSRRDETGEILSSGPQVFKGYWNNPRATAAALVEIDGRHLPAHRRSRAHGRRRLLLHRRPPEAHDQRGRLQGLAGRARGHALQAPGHQGSRHRLRARRRAVAKR